jgi:hypothetical protein
LANPGLAETDVSLPFSFRDFQVTALLLFLGRQGAQIPVDSMPKEQ